MKECDGCSYQKRMNDKNINCLVRFKYLEGIENCPCQKCIIKMICSTFCKERSDWKWFHIG